MTKGIKDVLLVHESIRLLDWEAYPLSGGEDIPGWLIVASDRSDYYRMQEMGERIERMVNTSNLLNVMAHEIRNPLSSIKGLFQLLKIRNDDPDTLQYLDIGINEVKRLTLLLNDFLSLGKASAISFEVVNFHEFLKDLLLLFSMEFRGIDIDIELNETTELLVEIDRQQMTQVIINIVKNSFEAMNQKGKVTFSLGRLGSDRVNILIRDTGAGVTADVLEKMFTPYYTSKLNGTGLGLTIVQTIIQNHGGEITAYNHSDGGACFSIVLPAYQSSKKELTAEILLITDDDMFIVPLMRILQSVNFSICSKTGLESIKQKIRQINPATVIIDGNYLDGDPLNTVMLGITSEFPSVKLIVIDGSPGNQANDSIVCIQRPLNYPKLVHMIRSSAEETAGDTQKVGTR